MLETSRTSWAGCCRTHCTRGCTGYSLIALLAAALRADLMRASTAVSQPSGPPLAFMAPPRGTLSPSPVGNTMHSKYCPYQPTKYCLHQCCAEEEAHLACEVHAIRIPPETTQDSAVTVGNAAKSCSKQNCRQGQTVTFPLNAHATTSGFIW